MARIGLSMLLVAVATAMGPCFSPAAKADQIIVRPENLNFSNDRYSDAGQTVGCIMTLAVVIPGDPRVLNFQFLWVQGKYAYKVTGGRFDRSTHEVRVLRVESAQFLPHDGIHVGAFKQSLTSEGQLVGVVVNSGYEPLFLQSFLFGQYSIQVIFEGERERIYDIESGPTPEVQNQFLSCLKEVRY